MCCRVEGGGDKKQGVYLGGEMNKNHGPVVLLDPRYYLTDSTVLF